MSPEIKGDEPATKRDIERVIELVVHSPGLQVLMHKLAESGFALERSLHLRRFAPEVNREVNRLKTRGV